MNKLSLYFSGKLPNSEKMNISDFINILDKNLNFFDNISLNKIKLKYITKYGCVKRDYDNFFNEIIKYKKIEDILEYFELNGLNEKKYSENNIVSTLLGLSNTNNYKKISRLEFCDLLVSIYGFNYQKITFFWEQSQKEEEKFYTLIIDFLEKDSKKDILSEKQFEKLMKEIGFVYSSNGEKIYDFKKISYYLAGQLPGKYRMPDILEIIDFMEELDNKINLDNILKLFNLVKNLDKIEYFQTLLKYFFRKSENKFINLLEKLKIPKDIYFFDENFNK